MNIVTNKLKKTTIITIIFLMISLVFLSTIAYSAISSTMHITGNAKARVEANVRITDFRIKNVTNATSSYEEFGKNHISTNVDLKTSSSTITYYLEITNYGTTDIGIFDITGLPTGINYSIKDYNLHDKICNEEGKCNSFIKRTYELTLTTTSSYSGNIQLNFDFRTYHKITYTDITNNNYPTEVIDGGTLKITFKEELKRVQVLYNNREILFYKTVANGQTVTLSNITKDLEVKIKEQVARLVKGELDEVGSEVCIGDECFYIISSDGSTVTMLAKYNLYVGNSADSNWNTTPLESPTGKQNQLARGYVDGEFPVIGTTAFSNSTQHGTSYSDYSGSIVEGYVNNYKSLLESNFGIEVEKARLITYNELTSDKIGCSYKEYTCENAPSFITATTYWVGTGANGYVYYVRSNGYFNGALHGEDYIYGVRPVIEISVDEILVPVAKLVSGNLGEVGSEVCIDNECFYTISSDEKNITMLSKYNLYVGGVYDGNTWTGYGEEATGIQDPTMLGYISSQTLRKGVTNFSNDSKKGEKYNDYHGSIVEGYVNNYKIYLESVNINIVEARLITKTELESFGCSSSDSTCNLAPSWIYSSSYWTGTAQDTSLIWRVSSTKNFDAREYGGKNYFGVRPVITISKKSIKDTI